MTILTQYAPEEFTLTDEREYAFTFPAADDGAVEVYEIIDEGEGPLRYRVPVQDYTLRWNTTSPRYPLKQNGVVQFSRLHATYATKVVIERNTFIDQTIDFPHRHSPFNGRMVEFAFDKAMMICQELAERKCQVDVTTPMTQEIVFASYDDFKASVVNFQVNKTFTILQEIDASAEDCTEEAAP